MHHSHTDDQHHDEPGQRRGSVSNARRRRLWVVLALTFAYLLAEIAGGLWTQSLALLADAGHMASDLGSLALTLLALWMSARPADARRTYGHARAEILAALLQGAALVAVAFSVGLEAAERLQAPTPVYGPGLVLIATGGLAVNAVGMAILARDRHGNLSLRGAWLHLMGDALGSIAAILAGVAIWWLGWTWVDPAASIAIAALILVSAVRLLSEAVDVLMESVPRHLDLDQLRGALLAIPTVDAVHDLHVWSIGSGDLALVAFSSHVVVAPGVAGDTVLGQVRRCLEERFSITHATVQVEADPEPAACKGSCPP